MDINKQPTTRYVLKNAHHHHPHTPPPYKAFDYAFSVPCAWSRQYYAQYRAMGVRFLEVISYDYYGNPDWSHFYDTGGFKHE